VTAIGNNVALEGHATQTSTANGTNNTADMAIDGDFLSCAATEMETHPKWSLKLSNHIIIYEVIISAGGFRQGKLFIYVIVGYLYCID